MSTTTRRPNSAVPEGAWPRLLALDAAAAYLSVGRTLFLEMVADGRMTKPKRINSLVRWDRRQIDAAIDNLPSDGEATEDVWDDVAP